MPRVAPRSVLRCAHATLLVAGVLAIARGAAAAPPEAPLPPPPVSIRVVAPSPDPPWTLQIDNEGDRPVRIPADVRLLSLEIQRAGTGPRRRCRPAPGQKPGRFPADRAIYLEPGESWVEQFDPRLFCFGAEGDLLRGGTVVHFRFGFDGGRARTEPFAVQSTDSPPRFAPMRELILPTIVLSHALVGPVVHEIPAGASLANAPLQKAPPPPPPPPRPASSDRHPDVGGAEPHEDAAGAHEGEAAVDAARPGDAGPAARPAQAHPRRRRPHGGRGASRDREPDGATADLEAARQREAERERRLRRERELAATYGEPALPRAPADRMAPDLDLRVEPWSSGSAPRDLLLRLQAENEGGRSLAAVVRSRMLRFRVEGPLTPQNQTTQTTECIVDDKQHGVSVEMVRSVRPGERVQIPFLLAEVCPRGTFDRPGLFRVTPVFTSAIQGEAVTDRDAFQGRIRALQPALARIGVSRLPFYDAPPRVVATSSIGRTADDEDLEEEEESIAPAAGDAPATPASEPPAP